MFVCMFVPYALLYHSSDCDETSMSCRAHAREGLCITFFLLNIKTFTKSATFHEIINLMLGMSAGHLSTTFVIASPEVGGITTTCK
jgi:hypothetical protein